jgi:hypothetical protein
VSETDRAFDELDGDAVLSLERDGLVVVVAGTVRLPS